MHTYPKENEEIFWWYFCEWLHSKMSNHDKSSATYRNTIKYDFKLYENMRVLNLKAIKKW